MKHLLMVIILFSLIGCSIKREFAERSGNINDEYVEEPLSAKVKDYASLLELSNELIIEISTKSYVSIYLQFAPRVRDTINEDDFIILMNNLMLEHGDIIDYKPQQWHFRTATENSVDLIYSIKIVEHEKSFLYYTFVFDKNNRDFLGMHFSKKESL